MNTAKTYVDQFDMIAHPEGGYYKEVYAHKKQFLPTDIDIDIKGKRHLSTSIYFLLEDEQVSHLHVLKSDEIWYYHDGNPLIIVMIVDGEIKRVQLGLDVLNGQVPQLLVPAGTIFGSYSEKKGDFSLVSCMVSPGFDFEDFRLVRAEELLNNFPEEADFIKRMCL